ncbi:unnamed protein product [Allacma fusca]|uniref:LRRNT domain-containing protein n=1 Tax=Allacma fusca TaxID=39272 RepID=A0A8J2K837_9HEXA|nr:unnamed protein product [Allacma fusca]
MKTLTFLLYLLSWTHFWQMTFAGSGEIESCAVQSVPATGITGPGGTAPTRVPGPSGTSQEGQFPGNSSNTTETLICQIRTLHSSLNLLTLTPSSSVPEQILQLKLICNDVLFFESSLSSPQLTPFRNLQELQILNCKLKLIENLGNLPLLRKLIITTGNSDWPQRTLRLNSTALRNSTGNLQILELGFNNILSLPPGFLCELRNLHTLNLTHNLLSNINDLGLNACPATLPHSNRPANTSGANNLNMGLKSLDLSSNSFETFDGFSSSGSEDFWESVQVLRLDHNHLSELREVLPLSQLRLLNLSSNHLISLAAQLLSASPHLRELHLRNNSLAALPPGLLQQLQHLRVLDLSQNQLQGSWISSGVFSKLYRLLHLNLSHNQFTHFGPTTFTDLFTLQSLDLSYNLISTLVDSPFQSLTTLLSLNLAHNRLTTIGPLTFKGLLSLQKLSLDYNDISSVDSISFGNSSEISDLSIVRNQLEKIPAGISKLRKLRTLDLGENRIDLLEDSSLMGLEQLYGLRLAGNLIPEIQKGFCSHTPKLRALNLASNLIQKIFAPSFGACPELRVLRLDSNKLEVFEPALQLELPNLLWLNVSGNGLRWLDYASLPRQLEWLDVSRNLLGNLKDDFRRSTLPRLRVLDLSFNNLTELDPLSVPMGLEVIKAGFNRIQKVAGDTFGGVGRLRRVELQGNQLSKLDLKALRLPIIAPENLNKSPLVELFLAGNPFLCDCDMEWLTRVNQLSSFRSMTVVDMDEIQCELSFSRSAEIEKRALGAMRPQDFLCGYTSHCFALCHCCEFDYCDCQMTCPEGCECFHDDTWSANVVNCAGRDVRAVPGALPMDSTQVYLDGNEILELKSHGFIGRKNLRSLYLNSSAIEKIGNKSFNGLHSLEILHLEENKLTELVGFEFEGLTRLQELHLQRNFIKSISNDTFLNLKSLEVLNLAGNLLFTFKVWQLNLNRNLGQVSLSGNQFECGNCEFLGLLHKWTRENARKIQDLENIRCVWNHTKNPGPFIQNYNSTCARIGNFIQFFDLTLPSPAFWYLVAGAGALFVISAVILTLVYAEPIKFCLFKCFHMRLSPASPGSKTSFDVTFFFSRQDAEFVRRLGDTLQAKGYRVLLAPDPKRALDARENSTTVTVLSKNFLHELNTDPEFRQVIFNVLQWTNYYTLCDNNKPNNSVIVVKDKIPKEKTREFFKSFEPKRRRLLEKRTLFFESKRIFWDKFTFQLGAPMGSSWKETPPPVPPPLHSHQNSDTGYGTSPSSSLVYKSNFHSAIESGSLNPENKSQWPYYSKEIPKPPPHFQDILRNSQFNLNLPQGTQLYSHNSSNNSGRVSQNTNSESSNNASPPSNATDTTTVDLELREEEPSMSQFYSHYYHEPVNRPQSRCNSNNPPLPHLKHNNPSVDEHYYFSLEPSPHGAERNSKERYKEPIIPPMQKDFRFTNPNARIQMQTFMV